MTNELEFNLENGGVDFGSITGYDESLIPSNDHQVSFVCAAGPQHGLEDLNVNFDSMENFDGLSFLQESNEAVPTATQQYGSFMDLLNSEFDDLTDQTAGQTIFNATNESQSANTADAWVDDVLMGFEPNPAETASELPSQQLSSTNVKTPAIHGNNSDGKVKPFPAIDFDSTAVVNPEENTIVDTADCITNMSAALHQFHPDKSFLEDQPFCFDSSLQSPNFQLSETNFGDLDKPPQMDYRIDQFLDSLINTESNALSYQPTFQSSFAPPVIPAEDLMFSGTFTLKTQQGDPLTAVGGFLETLDPRVLMKQVPEQGSNFPVIVAEENTDAAEENTDTAEENTDAAEKKIEFQPTSILQGRVITDTDDQYLQVSNLFAKWKSIGGAIFEYSTAGELKSPNSFRTWHWRAVKDFIYEHPADSNHRLTLWIQRTPTNCSQRYLTSQSGKCIFADCPAWKYDLQGTITRGHIRVAFDEKHATYGDKTDPYHCAAFAHLYCIERFLNLPEILTLTNVEVRVDSREMDLEPKGLFAGALTRDAALVAKRFIHAVKSNSLSRAFPSYPDHSKGPSADFTKLHSRTLNCAMQKAVNQTRTSSVRQRSGPNNIATHLGDIEMYCKAHKNVRVEQGKIMSRAFRKRKRLVVDSDDE